MVEGYRDGVVNVEEHLKNVKQVVIGVFCLHKGGVQVVNLNFDANGIVVGNHSAGI